MGYEETLRLLPKPVNARAGVVLCGAMAIGGLAMAVALRSWESLSFAGLMIAAAFAMVACLCAMSPKPGRIYLELTPEGFREQTVGGSRAFRWDEVDSFRLIPESEGWDEVGFRFRDGHPGRRKRGLIGRFAPVDVALHNAYGMRGPALVELLNEWCERHGAKPAPLKELVDDLV